MGFASKPLDQLVVVRVGPLSDPATPRRYRTFFAFLAGLSVGGLALRALDHERPAVGTEAHKTATPLVEVRDSGALGHGAGAATHPATRDFLLRKASVPRNVEAEQIVSSWFSPTVPRRIECLADLCRVEFAAVAGGQEASVLDWLAQRDGGGVLAPRCRAYAYAANEMPPESGTMAVYCLLPMTHDSQR